MSLNNHICVKASSALQTNQCSANRYSRRVFGWLGQWTKTACLGFFLLLAVLVPRAMAAPSLLGETVTVKLNYSVFADSLVNVDLFTNTFTVVAGAEIQNRAISVTFQSGGFPQTLTGTVSVDVDSNSIAVNFTGTQQAGSLTFTLSSINGESVASISSATQTAASGFMNGVNQPLTPAFSNTGDGSVTCGFFPFGFQPGVNLNQTTAIGLVAPSGSTAPSITTNPTNLTVTAGGTANFTAAASGSPTPTVQWQFSTNGGSTFLNLANATNTSLSVPNVTLAQGGTRYRAVFSNSAGSATTTAAILTAVPGPATQFVVSAPANATAGTAFNVTVTARDQFGNTATGYAGTVHFTTSDGQAVLPANSTLTSGVGTFSVTLKTAGTQTVTAADTVTPSINGTSGNISVGAASASQFTLSAPASATAGTAFNFTVTAKDPYGNTATGYAGTVHFTASDAQAVLPANSTLTSGVGTFSATLKTAGTRTITATDTVTASITGTSGNITVTAATATQLLVSAPANATAGTAFNFTVTARDAFGNTATSYAGTVHFTTSDGQAVLPANSTLASGVGTFSATLKTAGAQTLTATDTVTASITGTSGSISVSAASATQLLVNAPANATAGTAFNVTVTARDQFGNTAAGYAGTVHFTTSDGQAVLPANSTLTSGVGTFSATLKTAGTQTITATDTVAGSITGTSGSISVSPAGAAQFVVTAPATATAGTAFNFTVTARDAFGNTATGYTGTAHFTATDGQAVLPADSTLTSGVGTFSATLKTAGAQTITTTDTVTASITGTSGGINVSAASATQLLVNAPATATAGTAFTFTVTARDQFGNTASAYSGAVHFTASDAQAVLPADSTLTSGVGTFSATLKTAGSQAITATDTANGSLTGTSLGISVSPAAAASFVVVAPATVKARIASTFTVTARDAFGNTASGYSGTVHFTSTDALAVLPANSTLVNGVGTLSATFGTAGIQTLTATDTVTASVTGTSGSINVLDLQIVTPPTSQNVLLGSNFTFSVGVIGTAPFSYQWLANNVAVSGGTNASLTVSNITLLTATNYHVIVTNAWGSATSSVATLTVSGVFNYPQTGTARLNPLTGVYEEVVAVTNAGGTISGLRLLVGNLPPQVSLHNAAGTNNGLPYAQFAVTMTNQQVSTFLLQFFNPKRLSFTNTVQVQALAAGPGSTTGFTNTTPGIPISQVLMDTSVSGSTRFTLAFASTVGTTYRVLYTDDMSQTWFLADTVTASANWTIWTELLPPAPGSRFFKVIVQP